MHTYTRDEFLLHKEKILHQLHTGKLFIHPTDTIYGIGCDATNTKAVMAIREVKNRMTQSFKVIAPSKAWIREHCVVNEEAEEALAMLPGPYWLRLPLKNGFAVAPAVNPADNFIGVRIPNHWISEIVAEYGKPVLTTSANKVGEPFMTELDDLDPEIKTEIDFIIYEGPLRGQHSKLLDFSVMETKPL